VKIGDYDIIRYDPRYLDEVVELLVPLWGTNLELNKAYLEWKHNQNPYLQEPIIHLALYDEHPVGVRAYSASYWQAGHPDQRYLCVTDVDAVVHLDHRRHGLLKSMTSVALKELETEQFDFVITLSAAQNSSASNLKLGWENVGELRTGTARKTFADWPIFCGRYRFCL
jgi:hypothetical protein